MYKQTYRLKASIFHLEKIGSAEKSAVNLSAEIQPKKIWLAEKSAEFSLSQPEMEKKFGCGV
jgi:hypothetical protein